MSSLRCETSFSAYELQSVKFPVEVRTQDFTLVKQGVTGQDIEMAPGKYIVTAKMPAGHKLISELVEVGVEGTTTVYLTPKPEDTTPNESLEVRHFLSQAVKRRSAMREEYEGFLDLDLEKSESASPSAPGSAAGPAPAPKLELLVGNGLSEKFEPIHGNMPEFIPTPDGIRFRVEYQSDWEGRLPLGRFIREDGPAVNFRLPIFRGAPAESLYAEVSQCSIFAQAPDFIPDVHLQHNQADTLMHYLSQGQYSQADTMMTSLSDSVLSGEKMLQQKAADPIAAAVGAYMLLRLGELDRLHNWTDNLKEFFKWLPDGLIIRAEHLAREGDHQQALALLHQLPERGLPIFTAGLSYALDLLRSYARQNKSEPQTMSVLTALRGYARVMDFSSPLVTFISDNPNLAPPY